MARRRKDEGTIPKWAWISGILALAIIAGSFFSSDAGAGPQTKPRASASKPSSSASPPAKPKAASMGTKGSMVKNLKSLELLEQLSTQVSSIERAGNLNDQVAGEYLEMLDLLLSDIQGEDAISKQIRDMGHVVKGTLLAAGKGLDDGEVERQFNVSTYSSPKFWEQHYATGVVTDWYLEWTRSLAGGVSLKSLISEAGLRTDDEFLMLGCGNSPMSAEMYHDGYRRQHNIDVSPTVIEHMRQKYGPEMPGTTWAMVDARKMDNFSTAIFDGVIDKGTFDAVSTDEASLSAMLKEVSRVLRPGGAFVSIGSKRLPVLEAASEFTCGVVELQDEESQGRRLATSWMHRCRRVSN